MNDELLKILESTNANHIDAETALVQVLDLYNVRHSTSRKGTGWYMIFIAAICGLLGGVGWYHLGIEVGIFTLLILIVMFLASIRYNQ
tara:strand:+ start:94 stop:357 length:264 start_codon:yes stop_codon:yes gene_type:complete